MKLINVNLTLAKFLRMIYRICSVLSLGILFSGIYGQVVFNEIQSLNLNIVKDDYDDYPDWVELYNRSTEAVDLEGYGLSDDITDLFKWSFPDITLQPGEHILVFASGRDQRDLPLTWKTVISIGDEWLYIVPDASTSVDWINKDFNDSGWLTGKSGFGHGDDDDSTDVGQVMSVFIRKKFDVADLASLQQVILHVDYDDSFIAYINGVEVARANIGTTGVRVDYDAPADNSDHESNMYLGGSPETFDISTYLSEFVEGENTIAIEVHNAGATSSDMTLIPFLSLGTSGLGTSDVSEYPNLPNSFLHTNFKIKSGGESVYLSTTGMGIIDSINVNFVQGNISYGRIVDGGDEFTFFMEPTPGYTNSSSSGGELFYDSVTFSQPGGVYSSSLNISIEGALAGDSVFYTIDGSLPTSSSIYYNQPFTTDTSIVMRARILREGFLPGPVTSETYIIGNELDLPVVSLITDPKNLWSIESGIYIMGPNAENEPPYYGANFWMNWEKPAHMELIELDGSIPINQNIGIKIFGTWSRTKDQKSLSLFARNIYGDGDFDYKIFEDRDINKFESLVLHNGGNDWEYTYIRDALMSSLMSEMDVDKQAHRPVVLYLNGQYWGIMNIREKVNEHFIASHYPVDKDDINILENHGNIVHGSDETYWKMFNYLEVNNSLQTNEKYQHIADMIDVDNYIRYFLSQIYFFNYDWPGNNIKYWNTTKTADKFRWILFGTEFSMNIYGNRPASFNNLEFITDPYSVDWPNQAWASLLLRRMLTNTGFRNSFINQMADHINTSFKTEYAFPEVDSLAGIINNEIPDHFAKWPVRNYESWLYEIERIKDYLNQRPSYMRQFLREYFNLTGQHIITVSVSDEAHGKVKVNSVVPRDFPFSGVYFEDVPITLKAIPAAGYKFSGWEGANQTTDLTITYNMVGTASFNAVFEPAIESDYNIIINEINYNSSPDFPAGDWIELYNAGTSTADLSGWIFRDSNKDSAFVFPEGTILSPDGFLIVCKNEKDFKTQYPYIKSVIGDFIFGLSSDGDELRLLNSEGAVIDAIDYLSVKPWDPDANGTGATLELKSPVLDNSRPENWIAVGLHGTPYAINNSGLTSIDEQENIVTSTNKSFVFPNPFKDYTTLSFQLGYSGQIRIEVTDLSGKLITVLHEGYINEGEYTLNWIPDSRIVYGVYFIRIITSKSIKQHKVIYINN